MTFFEGKNTLLEISENRENPENVERLSQKSPLKNEKFDTLIVEVVYPSTFLTEPGIITVEYYCSPLLVMVMCLCMCACVCACVCVCMCVYFIHPRGAKTCRQTVLSISKYRLKLYKQIQN